MNANSFSLHLRFILSGYTAVVMKPLSFILALGLASAASAPLLAADVSLPIDKAQSRIEFAVKATVDSFTGQLTDFQPDVRLDPKEGRIISASVRFRLADLRTGKPDRDRQMLDWAKAPAHPDAGFRLTELAPATVAGQHVARGVFTFHGVEQPLEFPVSINLDGGHCAIDGEVTLDTRTHALPVIRKFAVLKVDPLVRVRFHLQASLPPAP
jgi:polyisoprenoid-binding protein YceI